MCVHASELECLCQLALVCNQSSFIHMCANYKGKQTERLDSQETGCRERESERIEGKEKDSQNK